MKGIKYMAKCEASKLSNNGTCFSRIPSKVEKEVTNENVIKIEVERIFFLKSLSGANDGSTNKTPTNKGKPYIDLNDKVQKWLARATNAP